jgi:EAL domain-containing protein (putative c-di-GMP-specific phosphodiesterase class I)
MSMAHEAALRASKPRAARIAWPDHQAVVAERQKLSLEGRLRRAVAQREFTVFYQPIMALQDGYRVVGAEALLRWPQPEGETPIGPDVFIPLAEELGLMDRLGLQVFEDSCYQLRLWQEAAGGRDFWVSVNLAPTQLKDPHLASRFVAIARQAGVDPSHIKLEVTESAFEEGFDVSGQVIDELAAAGFPLALDDFGTGHSSLSRLINMPFNLLKIDRSFVNQTPDGPGAAVVTSLRHLAGCLHLDSLGEGVESEAHEQFLRDLGYEYAQGYRYSKPLPAAEFDAWRAAR